jgi:hypothetical protein
VDQLNDYLYLERLLTGITYKPGFTMTVRPPISGDFGIGSVVFSCNVSDSRDPLKIIPVGRVVPVAPSLIEKASQAGPEYFYKWLFGQILSFERHEAQEWFKINGQVFDDPHKER